MFKPKDFELYELLSKDSHKKHKDNKFAWLMFDERLLHDLQNLRDLFGKITINDWYWGGNNEWRGIRTKESPWYSSTSQHSYGRAVDLIFNNVTAEQVRTYILSHQKDFKIRRLEKDVSWLHFDYGNSNKKDILVF